MASRGLITPPYCLGRGHCTHVHLNAQGALRIKELRVSLRKLIRGPNPKCEMEGNSISLLLLALLGTKNH
jgi:hypothetical protein